MFHVLVADNATARLFQGPDTTGSITEIYDFVNPSARLHEQDMVSSRPGRVINRAAGIHQSFDPETNARNHALAAWVHTLRKPLQTLLREKSSEGLILVASPRLLSALRKEMAGRIKIRGELARNLAKLSMSTLDKRLRPLLHTATIQRRVGRTHYRSFKLRDIESRTSESVV